ncbi:MAG: hypothetical protein QM504_08385 [Pseudomonadota bacterium]
MAEQEQDALKNSQLGFLVSSTLHKLEHVSDHHVQERRKHFRVTNFFVFIVSALLMIIAIVNMFYLYGFYQNTLRIIKTTHALDNTVIDISKSMNKIKQSMGKFNTHMSSMEGVYSDVSSISSVMPDMQKSMSSFQSNMNKMNRVMEFVNRDIQLIDFHLKGMTNSVSNLGSDMYKIARPMGMFNGMLP